MTRVLRLLPVAGLLGLALTARCTRRCRATPRPDLVAVTGRIGKPMLTLHGDLDALLPIQTDSDVYVQELRAAGKGVMHRYSVIEAGRRGAARRGARRAHRRRVSGRSG